MGFEITDHVYAKHKRGGPEASYQLSEKDEAGATRYYLYSNQEGQWMIMADTDSSVRYLFGDGDVPAAWAGRAGYAYKRWDEIWAAYENA